LKQLPAGGEAALTEGPDDFARFSSDGSMILFIRDEGPQTSLFRKPLLAGEPRKIVEDVAYADWSPDGRSIAFVRIKAQDSDIATSIGLAGANGENPREIAQVPNERLVHPRWSPDGGTIALSPASIQAGTAATVMLLAADGRTNRRLAVPKEGFGISGVAWTGNGELIYSLAESATGFLGTAGSTVRVMRHNVNSGAVKPLFWSPYGAQLVDIAEAGRLVFDTASPRVSMREYMLQGDKFTGGRWLTRGASHDRQPSYSPNGEWVIFSSDRTESLDLWEISTKTGEVQRLTEGAAEDWDPAFADRGKTVIWSSNRTGHFEVWMANVDGGEARQVSRDGVDAENPTMTPDGEWIVYGSGNPAKRGLWKIHRDGGNATRLIAGSAAMPEVSPDGRYVAFVTNIVPKSATLRVVGTADGKPSGFEAVLPIRNSNLSSSIGRSRWMPHGHAISFLGQDNRGINGIFVQDFVPGKNTTETRRPLAGFDEDTAAESFGISPDGTRLIVASWEQTFSLVVADKVSGITAPLKRGN
jgi:Tol biopolymer transport system component